MSSLFLKVTTTGLPKHSRNGMPDYTQLEKYDTARLLQVDVLVCDCALYALEHCTWVVSSGTLLEKQSESDKEEGFQGNLGSLVK